MLTMNGLRLKILGDAKGCKREKSSAQYETLDCEIPALAGVRRQVRE